MSNSKNIKTRRAFTLIELLIVIAIIGILFIVLVSKVDFATDKAKATGVQTDFRSFQLAFNTVARENQGFDDLIKENDYSDLTNAINHNLDNKLKIDIDADGKITMANGAADPWGVEYHGQYITGNDDKDRGALVMYSNGANLTFGSEVSITGGIASINIIDESGKDDYSISIIYSLKDGSGKVTVATNGFSINLKDTFYSNTNDNTSNDETNDSVSNNLLGTYEYIENRSAGLYETGTNNLIYSWEELVNMEIITEEGRGRGSNSLYHGAMGPDQDVVDILAGDLQFPKTLTTIPNNAFYACKNLTGVILPRNITTLGDKVFGECRIKTLVIFGPKNFNEAVGSKIDNIYYDSAESIVQSTYYVLMDVYFYSCNGVGPDTNIYVENNLLETLVVPNGCTSISTGPLFRYEKLKQVILSESCTTISRGAFYECFGLETINLDHVKKVNFNAFASTSLKNINLNSVESIATRAFVGCKNLENVLLGANLKTITFGSFSSCSPNLKIKFAGTIDDWSKAVELSTVTNFKNFKGITDGEVYELFVNSTIKVGGEFIVPDYWTSVPDGIFSGVNDITSLIIHDNIETIGTYAFYKTGIVDLTLNSGLKNVGDRAFSMISITTLNIPDSVIQIGEGAFQDCKYLTTVNINKTSNLTIFGNYAFSGCNALEGLYIPSNVTWLDAHGLITNTNISSFTFAPDIQLEYLNVSFGYLDDVTVYLPDSVKTIKDLDMNVNYNSKLIIGENSQLERMEGIIFWRYSENIYIPKNLYYISDSWAKYQFSPTITIHPENKYFKYESGCLIDIENKRLIASNSGAVIPTDGSVTSLGKSSCCYQISYIPKCITSINTHAFSNATGYRASITYEGTMAEWRAIQGTSNLSDFKQVTCSDGILNAKCEQIFPTNN